MVASESAAAVGVTGLPATVTTSIHYVGDGIPGGYNQLTNYKQIVVTVTRNSDSRQLASESTYIAPPARAPYGGINEVALGVSVTDIGDNEPVPGVGIALGGGPSAPESDTTDSNGSVLFAGMTANTTSGPQEYYTVTPTLPTGYVEMSGDVTQASLNPGQLTNLALRVYQPATIIVNLTSGGSPYTGSATVTVTPPSGSPQSFTVTGGSGSIGSLIPNGQYAVSASTTSGLVASTVTQTVPNDYPTDLTSTFNLALAQATGTLTVNAVNGTTPIAGASITVTGGPNGVDLTGTTDANGVANFPSIPAGSTPYTVSGTYGATSFSQSGVTVPDQRHQERHPRRLGRFGDGDRQERRRRGAERDRDTHRAKRVLCRRHDRRNGHLHLHERRRGQRLLARRRRRRRDGTGEHRHRHRQSVDHPDDADGAGRLGQGDGHRRLVEPDRGHPRHADRTQLALGDRRHERERQYTSRASARVAARYYVSASDGPATGAATVPTVGSGGTTNVALTLAIGSIQATVTVGGTPLAECGGLAHRPERLHGKRDHQRERRLHLRKRRRRLRLHGRQLPKAPPRPSKPASRSAPARPLTSRWRSRSARSR